MRAWLSARLVLLSLTVGLFCAAAAESQQRPTVRDAADSAGKTSFIANCSGCHGLDAGGGDRAPTIASGSNASRLSDTELKRIITHGISGTGMPAFGSLESAQVASIIGYLRTLQGSGKSAVMPGDSQRGMALFFGKRRCSDCHMANGKGGFIASDLTGYGSGRTSADIRHALVAPGDDSDQQPKEAVALTRSGEKYSGVVRAEDNFSLVLQRLSGEFVSLQKADLASLSRSTNTLMPRDYGSTLTSRELDDLVSYLISLKPHVDATADKATRKRHWEDEY